MGRCRFIWISTHLSDTLRQANRQDVNILASTSMPTRQRNLRWSSTRLCSAMRNLSSAREPKPSSMSSLAFLTTTGARKVSWNTSAQRWRTMIISEIGIPPTSTLRSIAVAVARSMTYQWTSVKATSLICSHSPHRTRAR